ncbi:MAG TPA: hypothetical protein VFV96_07250 [Verrucomicrobiae bacterium]|nr:hypothetical protein [Verrucomicrobiae bacterium]
MIYNFTCPLAAFLCLLYSTVVGQGAEYLIQGEFSYQVITLEGARPALHRKFEVVNNGCQWRINIDLTASPHLGTFVYAYDGTNLVYYTVKRGKEVKIGAGTIEASPVPQTLTSAGGEYPWLAYASSCYLKSVSNSSIFSLEAARSSDGRSRRFTMPAHIELNDDLPGLPRLIEYLARSRSLLNTNGAITEPVPTSSQEATYVNARFTSGEFTNVSGLSFPTQFEFRRYRPSPNSTSDANLRCTVIVRGAASTISVGPQTWSTSLPGRTFMAHDLRVQEPFVHYQITNSQIPTIDNSEVSNAREVQLQANKKIAPARMQPERPGKKYG